MVRETDEQHYNENYIISNLTLAGFKHKKDYEILNVPNIVNITYGRDVGYKIEQESFSKEIEDISATKIREKKFK